MDIRDKKALTIAGAVAAFFAGAIWINVAPSVVVLVAFLETAAGFGFGLLYSKLQNQELINEYKEKIKKLSESKKSNIKPIVKNN